MSKLTANQREFEKQIRRINRLINKVESEGLVFIKPPIEPVKPKRISKVKLEELKSTTLSTIRSKAYEVEESTGEVIPYKKPDLRSSRKRRAPGIQQTKPSSSEPSFLTPEQLHERRVEGARKAQETIKRRMREDPEYARQITEARRKALQNAREKMKKRMEEDPEYAKHMREVWAKNLEKARGTPRKPRTPKPITPPLTPEEKKKKEIEDQENAPDYTPANATDETLNNMYAILTSAVNVHIAKILIELADEQADEEGREEFARRLSTGNNSYFVLDLATKVAFYDSDKQEEVRQSAYTLASIITNGDVGQFTQDEIDTAIAKDFGGYYD